MKIKILIAIVCVLCVNETQTFAQKAFIYTKEGKTILNRKSVVDNCLRSLHKNRTDLVAVSICECQISKIDGSFTGRQYAKYKQNNVIDLQEMIKEDPAVEKSIQECYSNSGQTMLLQAQGFKNEFIAQCIKSIKENREKTLDINKLTSFCTCQLEMVKTKKITDAEMQTLSNPNALLFYEMMAKCGDPFTTAKDLNNTWEPRSAQDVNGPATDTISVLTLNSMTYVKVKIGSTIQVWLFDTGASDLLIDRDTEEALKTENIISDANYLGTGEYEMANGMVDTCRKYKVSNIQIGKYAINNVVVAVTDKGKRIIVGKALLNKFSQWVLNNRDNSLILTK